MVRYVSLRRRNMSSSNYRGISIGWKIIKDTCFDERAVDLNVLGIFCSLDSVRLCIESNVPGIISGISRACVFGNNAFQCKGFENLLGCGVGGNISY